jgi:hypothetical protein
LQDWVVGLGLRHQGALLTTVRGCDTAPKNDPSKMFVRCLRALILNAHCGDPAKARTFIEHATFIEVEQRFTLFSRNCDHYPHHYVIHLLHSIEIIGYKHPDRATMLLWRNFYDRLCRGLHLVPEEEEAMDSRLDADEETFARKDAV